MPKTIFEIGERAGFLTVISELPKHRYRRYLVRCACGAEKSMRGGDLRVAVSCGCRRGGLTHGETAHGKRTGERTAWMAMKARCLNPNASRYECYGGRGITICDRWLNSYEAFLADMGRRPTGEHSLDRVNNDGHYEPGNCRWATRSEQQRNKRKEIDQERLEKLLEALENA
jgi:hypothetical protein